MITFTRREFAAGVAALLSGASLGLSSKAIAQDDPKRGGHLRLAVIDGNNTDSLDPSTYVTSCLGIGVAYAVYNNLTEINEDGELMPELAESWTVSEDAKIWTFKLRRDVKFHDGKPLTADDVVASINIHRGEGSKSGAKGIVEQIVDISATNSQTVKIELTGGNADFAYILSDYHLVIVPSRGAVADWKSGIGTGGYKLARFDAGRQVSLKRNENYWKQGRAHFDTVDVLVISDKAARVTALVTKEVDVIEQVDLTSLEQLKRVPHVRVESTAGRTHRSIAMDTRLAPFNNVNVRLALKYAIDREDTLKKILSGQGSIGNDQPIARSSRYFDPSLKQRTYDPDRSKYYLKQAGLSKLSVDLHTAEAAFSGAVDMALLFRETAARAGININVIQEPNDGYWDNVWQKRPFFVGTWQGRPTEDWMFGLVYSANSPWNETKWNNARFNELLVRARSELADDRRRAMYAEMQRLVHDDGGTIIPVFADQVHAVSMDIRHRAKIASNYPLDGRKPIERWWFA